MVTRETYKVINMNCIVLGTDSNSQDICDPLIEPYLLLGKYRPNDLESFDLMCEILAITLREDSEHGLLIQYKRDL